MNIGILWDIENVTPPIGINYVQAIIDAVSDGGRLSYAMAFGDWSMENIKEIACELSEKNFELIHTPHRNRKNSADKSLIAKGIELLFKYPHIDRFVLISGDGDYRQLLLTFKKYGKEITVVCDITKNASKELIKIADKNIDCRKIRKQMDEFEDAPAGMGKNKNNLTKEEAFKLFKKAVGVLIQGGKNPSSPSVKNQMQLLNNQFNEKELNYSTWREFVEDAKSHTNITFENGSFVL
jgi:hypothetical protein